MSRNGGYKIINLNQTAFTSGQEASLDGLYSRLKNAHGKATLISGLIVGDVVYADFFAPFIVNGANYVTSVVIGSNTISITVTADDNITVTVQGA